jgi:ADP-ribose pyrophosphatase
MKNTKTPISAKARVLNSKTVYQGKVLTVALDEVHEPSGVTTVREVVRHQGSAVVLPVDDTRAEPRILLEEQFRYAANEMLWEVPAGRIDGGESALEAAKRELLEETGFSAARWQHAFYFFASPGFLAERMDVFLARGLKPGEAQPEDDERIKVKFFPLSTALRMCLNGKIHDAKTMTAIFWYAYSRRKRSS